MKNPNIIGAVIVGVSIIVASLIVSAALMHTAAKTHYAGDRIAYAILNQEK